MLSERAITALRDLKQEMLQPIEFVSGLTTEHVPEELPEGVRLEGRWKERERKPQPMNHAKKKGMGFQTMCQRREW